MKVSYITLLSATTALFAPLALNAQQADAAPAGEAAEEQPLLTVPVDGNVTRKEGEGIDIKVNDKATISVSGFVQAQYYWSDSAKNSGDAYNGFAIRRASISAKGKIGDNWSAEVGFEIDSSNKGDTLDDAFVDKAIISYTCDYGKLTAGYQKVSFILEEYSSSKTALTIEHGIASRYFEKTDGFSSIVSRHGGVWWDGKIKFDDGKNAIKYTVAVTNQYSEDMNSEENSGVAFFGNISYEFKVEDINIELGLNAAYNPGNDDMGATREFEASDETRAPHGPVYGFEPYAKITCGNLSVLADVIYADGDEDAEIEDSAWGANVTVAYRIDDLEPVFRFSYIDVGDNENLGPGTLKNMPAGDDVGDQDSAFGIYVGANYYVNKSIKLSAGYEYTSFDGGKNDVDANSFRVQLQAVF